MSRIDRRDVAEAISSGGVAFAWYALPDAVRSARARAGIKVALLAPSLVIAAAQTRRATHAALPGTSGATPGTTQGTTPGATTSPPTDDAGRPHTDADHPHADDRAATLARIRTLTSTAPAVDLEDLDEPAHGSRARLIRQGALLASGIVALGAVVAGTVAAERGLFRLGERLTTQGTRWPHSKIGLVAALAAGGLSLATAPLVPESESNS